MKLEFAALLISAGSLIVALISAVASYRLTKAQNRLQERLLALEGTRERARIRESRRARLIGRVVRFDTNYRLVVSNEGSGIARRICTSLDGQPITQHPLVPAGQSQATELGPGAEAEYLLAVAMGRPNIVTVSLTWEDDSGEPGAWTSQLTL